MSEYVKCPLCGIETKANEAHGCAGPRVEVIDPRDARIAALEAENAKLREALERHRQDRQGTGGNAMSDEREYQAPPWSRREAFIQRHGCTPEQYEALMEWARREAARK